MYPSSSTLPGSAIKCGRRQGIRNRLPCLVSHEQEVSTAVMEEFQEVRQQE